MHIDPDLKTQVQASLYKGSLHAFLKGFWHIYSQDPFVDSAHVKYLCDTAQEIVERVIRREDKKGDLIVNVPPGSSKSAIFSVMMPAWAWTIAPWLRFITGSYEKGLATRMSVASRNVIRCELYQELFGDVFTMKDDQDGKTEYANDKTGMRLVCSAGGSITGSHAHIIDIDDPLNPKSALARTDAVKNEVNAWFDHTLPTRKAEPRAAAVTMLIMQRLAYDDPTGHLLGKGKNIKHICLPGELTNATKVEPPELESLYVDGFLDKKRSGRVVLDELLNDLGPKDFAGQILQLPAAAEGNIYKREYWNFYTHGVLPKTKILRTIHSWDTAFKKGKENDKSACIVANEYASGLYILDVYSGKPEFPELNNLIRVMAAKYGCHVCLIEDKASGQSLIQVLHNETTIPVIGIKPEGDKVARASASTPYCESGNVYFPDNQPWVRDFIENLAGFPDLKYKDEADAFSQLINYIQANPVRCDWSSLGTASIDTRGVQGW